MSNETEKKTRSTVVVVVLALLGATLAVVALWLTLGGKADEPALVDSAHGENAPWSLVQTYAYPHEEVVDRPAVERDEAAYPGLPAGFEVVVEDSASGSNGNSGA